MRGARRALLATLALTALARCDCGNSPCKHLAQAEGQLPKKAAQCPSLTFTPFDEKRCEASSGSCTNDDFLQIDNSATCVEQLPDCVPGDEAGWVSAIQACAPSVGPACAPAVQQ